MASSFFSFFKRIVSDSLFDKKHRRPEYYTHDTNYHLAMINISRMVPASIVLIIDTIVVLAFGALNVSLALPMAYFYAAYLALIIIGVAAILLSHSLLNRGAVSIWTMRITYWVYWFLVITIITVLYLMDAYSSGSMASLFAFYLILAAVPIFNLWEIIIFLNIPNLLTIGVMVLDLLTFKEAIYTILTYAVFAIAMSWTFYRTYFRLLDAEKQLEAARNQLETMSVTDPLTGVLNRYGLDRIFTGFKGGKPKIETITAIAMDIDFFKDYNDSFGHLVGDECLVRIANAINFVFVGENAKIGRIGGDEFVVLLADADEKKIKEIMDHLYKSVGDLSISAGNQSVSGFLTVSCGIATANLESLSSWTDIFAMADKVLYQMKKNGRNQYLISSDKA